MPSRRAASSNDSILKYIIFLMENQLAENNSEISSDLINKYSLFFGVHGTNIVNSLERLVAMNDDLLLKGGSTPE